MNTTLQDDPILKIPEVAKYLQISRSKAYYMAYKKQLPILRIGKKNIRIRMSDLKAWIDKQVQTSN